MELRCVDAGHEKAVAAFDGLVGLEVFRDGCDGCGSHLVPPALRVFVQELPKLLSHYRDAHRGKELNHPEGSETKRVSLCQEGIANQSRCNAYNGNKVNA